MMRKLFVIVIAILFLFISRNAFAQRIINLRHYLLNSETIDSLHVKTLHVDSLKIWNGSFLFYVGNMTFRGALVLEESSGADSLFTVYPSSDDVVTDWYANNSITNRIHANGSSYINGGPLGIGTTTPDGKFDVNLGTADSLVLAYNDADGSAAVFASFKLSSDGDLTIRTIDDDGTSGSIWLYPDKHVRISDGNFLVTDRVRALDSGGLQLYDDSGLGIDIADGGDVSCYGGLTVNENMRDVDIIFRSDNHDSLWVMDGGTASIYAKSIGQGSGGSGTDLVIINNTDEIVKKSSSLKYKNYVTDWDPDLSKFKEIDARSWVWNDSSATPGVEGYGLVMEEITGLYPEVKHSDEDYDTRAVIAILIAKTQQLESDLQRVKISLTVLFILTVSLAIALFRRKTK